MIISLVNGINSVFSIFYLLVLVRCALSFIPNIDWHKQPFLAIIQVVDPYLNIFKNFIPPIGLVDISPIVAIIFLGIIQKAIVYAILVLATSYAH